MCAATASRTCSRAASSATCAITTAGKASLGRASIRSICSISRRTGTAAEVRPSASPSRSVSIVWAMAVG